MATKSSAKRDLILLLLQGPHRVMAVNISPKCLPWTGTMFAKNDSEILGKTMLNREEELYLSRLILS
jgi:hypothetical protein